MLSLRHFVVVAGTLLLLLPAIYLAIGPWPHDSWFRTAAGNRAHALELLPQAWVLHPADTCPPVHFGHDEQYGVWVQDFQMILAGPEPVAAFRELAESKARVAQLYGLAGLYLTDRPSFERRHAALEVFDTMISIAESCDWEERPLAQIVSELADGYWTAQLTKHKVDVH